MPYKEKTNEEKYLEQYDNMEISLSKARTEEDRKTIATNWAKTEAGFTDDTISNALEQRDEMNERESNMSGGMAKYNNGGSILMPPEREGYMVGALIKGAARAAKNVKSTANKKLDNLSGITKDTPGRTAKDRGVVVGKDRTQAFKTTEQIKGAIKGIGALLVGQEAYSALSSKEQGQLDVQTTESNSSEERINPKDYPIYAQGSESAINFRNSQRTAKQNEQDVFEFEGRLYNIIEAEAKNMGGKMSYNEGGKMKYAEGSMLMPPEMGMEEDMPVDTYDNIPEDEMAAAEASQLPDNEMEDGYLEFVLNESLETDDQEYLMSVLETDERLSGIFDKVMDVAGEFSGEGEVDGPGTGVSDSIPARLSDGEFVFTKKATDQMGADQLQTMMDEAEKAYDGGLMKKAFGGLTLDPMQDEKMMYGGEQMKSTQDDLRKQMLSANRMPSVLK